MRMWISPSSLLALCSLSWGADVSFEEVIVDNHPPNRPYYKMAGDLNGDGLKDIVVAGDRQTLVYYAAPDWTKKQIAQSGWHGVNGEVGDVDGDGDLDIVMGGVIWFSNPGQDAAPWPMTRIDNREAHDIELADLNRDGRLDVVARDQSAFGGSGNTIFIYYQQSPTTWARQTLDCPHGEGLKLADMDRDGAPDIVIAGRWYENHPEQDEQQWIERVYTDDWTEPDAKVETADFNSDGLLDIVLTPAELRGEYYKVAWYEATSDPAAASWPEHVIVPKIESVIHSLGTGDFDKDGAIDIAIAEMHQGEDPDEVSVYFNQAAGKQWTQLVLSRSGSHDLVVADVDGDGDQDIFGANHAGRSHPLVLWVNQLRGRKPR